MILCSSIKVYSHLLIKDSASFHSASFLMQMEERYFMEYHVKANRIWSTISPGRLRSALGLLCHRAYVWMAALFLWTKNIAPMFLRECHICHQQLDNIVYFYYPSSIQRIFKNYGVFFENYSMSKWMKERVNDHSERPNKELEFLDLLVGNLY